ncbi:MAG: hypothetical protein LKJ88_06930 [Bacilli bacterium]|nr:hypothetical protein [Bacilli bacterium]
MIKKQYIDECVVYDGEYTPDPWEECAGIKKPKAGYVLFEAKGKDGKKAIQIRKPTLSVNDNINLSVSDN